METKLTSNKDYIAKYYFTKSNRRIADELGITESVVRGHAKRLGLPAKTVMQSKSFETDQQYADAFQKELNKAGFKQEWSAGWLKTEEVSVYVQNNQFDGDAYKENLLKLIKDNAPVATPKIPEVKDGHLLIIDPADVHVGKLASSNECATEYGVNQAINRVMLGLEGLLVRASSFKIDEVLFVIGNDVLHTDTPFAKTTAGTPQNTDQMWYDAYTAAFKMYIQCIDRVAKIAKVNVVFNPSNHDFMSGFFLAQSLQSYYTHNKNVVFDVSIKHRKYFMYGENLIGTSHGDGAKENDLPALMAQEAKEMWGASKHWYWYLHHVHHMKKIKYRDGEDYNGVTIEYLRAVSPSDGWHTRNGYVSNSGMTAFIHHKKQGQVARLIYNYN